MRKRTGIYVASRASLPERAAMWRRLRDVEGWDICSTWIDEAGENETGEFSELWERIEREIRGAERLILYVEPGDFPIKGAMIEAGIAIAAGVQIFVVAPGVDIEPRSRRPLGSWICHPLVRVVPDMAAALVNAPRRAAARIGARTGLTGLVRNLWRQHTRWTLADRKGWGWAGRLLRAQTQEKADKAVRNSNRLYRLTRGSGNPWRD
jgi:hypothetical protein